MKTPPATVPPQTSASAPAPILRAYVVEDGIQPGKFAIELRALTPGTIAVHSYLSIRGRTAFCNQTARKHAKDHNARQPRVTLNHEQQLFVVRESYGYSCLGFDVCERRTIGLAAELNATGAALIDMNDRPEKGTLAAYEFHQKIQKVAREHHEDTGYRFTCELSPQLVGLEGKRVEVITSADETRRFTVDKSTGWIPIHLEVSNSRSHGGMGADQSYKSVRVIA
jgi:hypothetical protein